MLLATGLVLPFLTGQVPQVGNMLLPMHLPVMLCGLICGWRYGLVVGAVTPLLRSLLFSMPVLYPNAIAMAIELAVYGVSIGIISQLLCKTEPFGKRAALRAYASLVPAMLLGRVAWGIAQLVLLGVKGSAFTLAAFLSGAFVSAVPGIIIQLVLVPWIYAAVVRLERAK